jgi:CheY-like chemotaxis protein
MDKPLSDRRILVVEDEMILLITIEQVLAGLGCESVTTAVTVDQALALLDAQTFDAAMLDVNLRGEISYPVADALIARDVPFVFTTGYSDHGMRDGYRDWPVLKKPYKFEKLAEMLTQLVSR